MDRIIGCCGIKCNSCDAYLATKNNDDTLRRSTAENWNKKYNFNIETKDVNCLGCGSEVLFSLCFKCNIRKCNMEKSQENCSKCADYTCEKINGFFNSVPEAKNTLDSLRQQK